MVGVAAELRAHGYRDESRSMAGRALDWFNRTELSPEYMQSGRELSIAALCLLGRDLEAYELARKLLESEPDSWSNEATVGIAAAVIGDRATALKMSSRLAEVEEPFTMGRPSYHRAAIAAQLGDRAEAIRLLQRATTRGFNDWNYLHIDIAFDPIRDDPEFQEILRPKG